MGTKSELLDKIQLKERELLEIKFNSTKMEIRAN